MHFAIMEESHYPPEISGTAIGIICTLGYLPESISPAIAGRLLDMYPGTVGYRYYFFYLLAVCAIGLVLTTIWLKITKEKRQQILEINKLKKQNI
jgi:sugar phosphate permease